MAGHIFTVKSPNDEHVEYSLDGEHLITANYTDHGWAGMEAIDQMVSKIAVQIGAELQHVACEGSDA
jgi:hypothetical protein